jgi:HNH endonuclease
MRDSTGDQRDPQTSEAMQFYTRHYTAVFHGAFNSGKRTVLEDATADGVRRCRFCGRSNAEVPFHNNAHVVPEFLGNKSVFTRNECDECNHGLARSVEEHLAKFLSAIRTVSGIRGKRGFPKYKAQDGSAQIERTEAGLHFDLRTWDVVKTDRPDPTEMSATDMALSLPGEPFIPVAAAKCLVKIACCLAPLEDMPHLKQTIAWVTSQDHSACTLQIDPMPVRYSFTPGPMPHGAGKVILMRRRNDEERVPYLIVAIATTNHLFATFAPFCAKDDCSRNECSFELCHFPVPSPAETVYGRTMYSTLDWSSTAPETHTCNFTMRLRKNVPD